MQTDIETLQERITQLEGALTSTHGDWVVFGLSASECRIFAAMMNLPVLRRDSMQLLMANTKDDAVTANAETVLIYRMRKKLKKHGIDISTVAGLGYKLTNEMKDRARGLR